MPRPASLLALVALLALVEPRPAAADDLAARARRLHTSAIVVDTHIDTPDALSEKWGDVKHRGATPHFDIPRAREGGLSAGFFSIYVASSYADSGTAAGRALELIDLTRRVVRENPRALTLAASVADIRAAKKAGRIAILMGIEGGHALENNLGALRTFHHLGVRYVTLTHTNTNDWADSSGPFYLPDFDPAKVARHGGLNDLGREIVREMNRIGMIVDVSHVSDDTLADVLEVSSAPVMASHSSVRAISAMPRNLTDAQIEAIAAKGGVVMINYGSEFLDGDIYAEAARNRLSLKPEYLELKKKLGNDPKKLRAELKAMRKRFPERRTHWTKIVDHIEHVLRVGGPHAAGLGSDFDGVTDLPLGMDDVSMLPKITEELLRRGHSEEVVRGVLGENFLRFFARVEATARR
jgi:membrane dipeptidase